MLNDGSRDPGSADCRNAALEVFGSVLDYRIVDGRSRAFAREQAGGGEFEPFLAGRLHAALQAINPGLSESGARQAAASLRQPVAAGLLDANETCHRLISRWITIEEFDPATRRPVGRSVRFIDFDDPENNEFVLVEDFSVKGIGGFRRFDLMIVVNGIPVVAIECAQSGDPPGPEAAVRRLVSVQNPGDGFARLFCTLQFCVALDHDTARFGTVGTPPNRYAEWKRVFPGSESALRKALDRKVNPRDRLIAGLCAKANLLDLIRNFTVFDREAGQRVRKVARYQQFEAVNRAVRRAIGSPGGGKRVLRNRGGIVWHTQGSGKSLTMLWLGLKLRREPRLENPTLLVVTDRRDLDRQINETFRNCGFENPVRAEKVSHLRKLLRGPSGQTILTTIQKFRDDVTDSVGKRGRRKSEPLASGGNLFVLIDEAHRTEYGLFNARLRKALPDACLIAFTGTPIPKTEQTFGSYIHRYTMPQSVEDGATVPILYENRLPKLAVWGGQIDPSFEAELGRLSKSRREDLKRQEITSRKIAEAPERIAMIAADLFAHYRENFECDGFKAQVAACSQRAAAMLWGELDRLMPGRVALLISDPSEKDHRLRELRARFADEEAIIERFKNGPVEELAILVVMNKYLTGFDAPIERVLYLDKPLKDHTLLQAIARVNRPCPWKDKPWGLVVDYWGVAGFLDEALENLGEDIRPGSIMKPRYHEGAITNLRRSFEDAFACFPPELDRAEIEPWVLALEAEDDRAAFAIRFQVFHRALERLLPDPAALALIEDFAWLRKVRREGFNWYRPEEAPLPDCSEKIRQLIDRHVKNRDITVLQDPVPILTPDFHRQMQALRSDRARAIRMRHAIRQTISVKLQEDPVFYESLSDRLKRIIEESESNRRDEAAEFECLSELAKDLEAKRAGEEPSGLSAEVAPFFRSIRQTVMGTGEAKVTRVREKTVDAAKLVRLAEKIHGSLREAAVIDWDQKENAQRAMRREIKRHLRKSYQVPSAEVESLTAILMDLARVHLAN